MKQLPYFDISKTLLELSSDSNSTWLFWTLIIYKEDQTNITRISTTILSKAEVGKLARGYKVLHKLGIVTRVKNQHYLINPTVSIPPLTHIDKVIKHWNEVCPEFKI